MHRHSQAARHDLAPARPEPFTASPAVDLVTLRLVLRQHLDDLRQRGAGDDILRPIETELRRFDATIDLLVEQQQATAAGTSGSMTESDQPDAGPSPFDAPEFLLPPFALPPFTLPTYEQDEPPAPQR